MKSEDSSAELRALRRTIVEMVYRSGEGHIPSAFSILEIVYVLYKHCLRFQPRDPAWDGRDIFVLSKGHAGAALYAVLSAAGFFERNLLLAYCQPGSRFGGHPDRNKVPGVEACTGSLGHGIAMSAGISIVLRHRKQENRVVVLVGDGEMEEGSFWESMMLIRDLGLRNIVVIADVNRSQQKYACGFDFAKILGGFGWGTSTVNGHDLAALESCLQESLRRSAGGPQFVVAETVKGFGVARFALPGDNAWHRRTPTAEEYREIMTELA